MKTFEGTFTIKWYKNDHGDVRPLTIDCLPVELNSRKNEIKEAFMKLGENNRYAYSVSFDLSARP
jgi:hypothetical protein